MKANSAGASRPAVVELSLCWNRCKIPAVELVVLTPPCVLRGLGSRGRNVHADSEGPKGRHRHWNGVRNFGQQHGIGDPPAHLVGIAGRVQPVQEKHSLTGPSRNRGLVGLPNVEQTYSLLARKQLPSLSRSILQHADSLVPQRAAHHCLRLWRSVRGCRPSPILSAQVSKGILGTAKRTGSQGCLAAHLGRRPASCLVDPGIGGERGIRNLSGVLESTLLKMPKLPHLPWHLGPYWPRRYRCEKRMRI